MTDHSSQPPRRFSFGSSRRLHGHRIFEAVYHAGCRKIAGPLTLYTQPNDSGHSRLGLSIPRRVGTAVQRNRIKRLLREAFRLSQHDWPGSYDIVISVRPHQPLKLEDYRRLLSQAMQSAHLHWLRYKSSRTKDNVHLNSTPPPQTDEDS